jgi:hypothetical protein
MTSSLSSGKYFAVIGMGPWAKKELQVFGGISLVIIWFIASAK